MGIGNEKPSFRKKRQAASLAAMADAVIEPALRQRGFANATLLKEWPEIVGADLAAHTTPIEIRWPRRYDSPDAGEKPQRTQKQERAGQPVLTVACAGAFALEVSMAAPRIIEAVNRRLGFGCIGAIALLQMPRPARAASPTAPAPDPALLARLEATLSDIEAPELRAALARMGAAVAAKPKA